MSNPVFVLELPLELAPMMNAINGLKPWSKAKIRESIDLNIEELGEPPQATGARRRVVVTRYSSQRPDELAVDLIGGKYPVDRLVKAGILAGDSSKHLDREARWTKAKPGAGYLRIEVYEIGAEAA